MRKKNVSRQELFFKPGIRIYWLGFAARPFLDRSKVGKKIVAYSLWPIDVHIVKRRKK